MTNEGSACKVVRIARRDWPAAARLSTERAAMVWDYLPLVRAHIRRRVKCQEDVIRRCADDLFQEGCVGLIRAALRFDPGGGISFAAFARARIRGAVSRALRRQSDRRWMTVPEGVRVVAEGWLPDPEDEDADGRRSRVDLEDRLRRTLRRAELLLADQQTWASAKLEQETGPAGMKHRVVELDPEQGRRLRARIVKHMLRVDDEEPESLREIARKVGVPFSRARRCVRDLRVATQMLLAADPDLPVRLRRWAQREVIKAGAAGKSRHDPVDGKFEISPQQRLELLLEGRRQRQQRYRKRLRSRRCGAAKVPKNKEKMRHRPT